MTPTINRIVTYRLSADDANAIKANRGGESTKRGNNVSLGQAFPMLIVQTWGATPDSCVNGQVFLDGNDTLWVTSVKCGEGPRTFSWPTPAGAQHVPPAVNIANLDALNEKIRADLKAAAPKPKPAEPVISGAMIEAAARALYAIDPGWDDKDICPCCGPQGEPMTWEEVVECGVADEWLIPAHIALRAALKVAFN